MSQTTNKLTEHIVRSNEAMAVLFEINHHEAALILLFSWVDRLAWLSVKGDYSCGADFKAWLNKYLFIETSKLTCNANDLWASRCGLLHTGTAEARDVKNQSARRAYYYSGKIFVTAKNADEQVYINTGDLHTELISATVRFLNHLEINSSELAIANKKLGKILIHTTNI